MVFGCCYTFYISKIHQISWISTYVIQLMRDFFGLVCRNKTWNFMTYSFRTNLTGYVGTWKHRVGNFRMPVANRLLRKNKGKHQAVDKVLIAYWLTDWFSRKSPAFYMRPRTRSCGVSHQVTLIGVVRSVKEGETRHEYKIDDMTAPPLKVLIFIESDVSSSHTASRPLQ